ncbi:MAG: hypothetical protein IIU61_07305, partial [Alistipes sp.]|nr:hypothetical protein [Alistipes sp.]
MLLSKEVIIELHLTGYKIKRYIASISYDVARAKKLLAEAGYAEGELTFDLYAATDDPYKTIAPLVQNNL